MNRQDEGNGRVEDYEQTNRLSHLLLLFVIIITFLFYFGYNDSPPKEEPETVSMIRANIEDSTIFYHLKTYLHSSYTFPHTLLKLKNEVQLNFEPTTKEKILIDHTLSWRYLENSRLHFKPFKYVFGLIAISAIKVETNNQGNFIYFGLFRAHPKYCTESASWTCQKDYDNFNNAFDAKYCIIVIKSKRISDLLQFKLDHLEPDSKPNSDIELGRFCGNPLISRSANNEDEVFFVNFNTESDYKSSPFFLCKFSMPLMEVTCFNTEVSSSKISLPLAILHDPISDVLISTNYNPENKNLNILTFNTSRLSFKAAYRSIPTPSGWLISLGSNSKGKLFFAGDAAPYELLGVFDLATSREKYHNLYP